MHATRHPSRKLFSLALLTLAIGLGGASATLLAETPAAASAPATDPSFEAAFQAFSQAAGGDEKAIERAAEAFGALQRAQPADPVLMAYAGASTAMKASTTLLPWRKMAWAEEGLAMQDKALALLTLASDAPAHRRTPASLETRFVVANTFLRMPSMFNRHARGEKLLDQVLNNPLLATSPAPFRATVWLLAAAQAKEAKRVDDARRWLQQVVDSGAPQAATAQAKLKELGT